MRVPLSWLRDLAPVDASVDDLVHHLSDLGLAVESVDAVGGGLDGVVVAKVLALRPHPDADRVQLVDVDAGDGAARQVVCGAFNMAEGDHVPLATAGAVLPNGMEIGRRKVRGQWSEGMLCAPDELGLPGGHDGILVLPPHTVPGAPLAEALGIAPDVVFELEVNPNRPDALSVAGVARDLAARLGVPFALPEPQVHESGRPAGSMATVEIADPDLCGRFAARVLTGVQVGPSPQWLAARLTMAGMRPINNVVDASNYVMLELGQPNHPYDLARLGGRGLRVRRAREGEQLVTLDDVTRTFTGDDLLICDAEDAPVGIAGIMGGASSEIGDATAEVLLEVAWFQPLSVARTAKRLGLRTEASARFERGCDPDMVPRAADRFCELLGGAASVAPGVIDVRGELPERPRVRLRTSRVNALLGTDLGTDEIRGHLEPIGFSTEAVDDGTLEVTVPSWRPDSAIEVDLIEEVARHHGYMRIPRTVPPSAHTGTLTPYQRGRRLVRQILAGAGASEAWCTTFLAPGDLERAGLSGDAVRVVNPLATEESLLRTSLLPGLLKALAHNAAHRNPHVALFEVGRVFHRPPEGQQLPDEREVVAAAVGGAEAPEAVTVWAQVAEGLLIGEHRLEAATVPGLHPTRAARVVAGDQPVGALGEVDPEVLEAYGVPGRVAWLELDLGVLLAVPHGEGRYRPVSRFPSSDVDLSFTVPETVPAGEVARTIRAAGGDLLVSVALLDVFRGAQVGEGSRSLTFRLRLQAADRTLADDDIAGVRLACIEAVEAAHAARLRG